MFSLCPVLQLIYMDLHRCKCESTTMDTNYMFYMADPLIVKVCGAIFISTIAMSTLEPCLPIWLMETLNPEVCIFSLHKFKFNVNYILKFNLIVFSQKWQIGTVFIPDSIGYFVSTNFLAVLAHQAGSMPTAIIALLVVGFSCLMVILQFQCEHQKKNEL